MLMESVQMKEDVLAAFKLQVKRICIGVFSFVPSLYNPADIEMCRLFQGDERERDKSWEHLEAIAMPLETHGPKYPLHLGHSRTK